MTDAPIPLLVTDGLARWWTRWRPTAYWLLWLWLAFGLCGSAFDSVQYLDDPTTYHQVYRDPALQQAVSRAFGILQVTGLVTLAIGFRERRFSRFAVSVVFLELIYLVLYSQADIIVICCG